MRRRWTRSVSVKSSMITVFLLSRDDDPASSLSGASSSSSDSVPLSPLSPPLPLSPSLSSPKISALILFHSSSLSSYSSS